MTSVITMIVLTVSISDCVSNLRHYSNSVQFARFIHWLVRFCYIPINSCYDISISFATEFIETRFIVKMVLGKSPPGKFPPLNSPRSDCLPVTCPTPNLTLDEGGFTVGIDLGEIFRTLFK